MFPVNVFVAQAADFTDAETGRIQECDHGLLLQIRDRRNEDPGFLHGRDIGEVFVKPARRELGIVPGRMKDVQGKEAELRDRAVDGPVGKTPGFLEPADKIPQFCPGDIFREFVQDRQKIIQIGADISTVAFEGMVSKTAEGNHFPERIEIFVHDKSPLKCIKETEAFMNSRSFRRLYQ